MRHNENKLARRSEMINKFCNNTKIVNGEKALEGLTFELQQSGVKRPMLICDDMSNRLGFLNEVIKAFNNYDIKFQIIFKKVDNIATVEQCESLLKIYRANDCDGILALGRRGVVSTAKAIKIMLKDGISFVNSYEKSELSDYSIMRVPLFVVPTYLASGLECSNRIRVYDNSNNKVYEFETEFGRSTAVIIDERMTDTVPPKRIASYGLFALCASTMAYLNPNDTIFNKAYARTAIQLVAENLVPCVLHNAKKIFRLNIMSAVIFGGQALTSDSSCIVEDIAHKIADRYKCNIPTTYAILFRKYFKIHKWDNNLLDRLLLHLIGEEGYASYNDTNRVEKTYEEFEKFFTRLEELVEFNNKLEKLGVEKSDFASIAEEVIANSKVLDKERTYSFIVDLLEKCF